MKAIITIWLLFVNASLIKCGDEEDKDNGFLVKCDNPVLKSADNQANHGLTSRHHSSSKNHTLCSTRHSVDDPKLFKLCKDNYDEYFKSISEPPTWMELYDYATNCNKKIVVKNKRAIECPFMLIQLRKLCWTINDITTVTKFYPDLFKRRQIVKITPTDWNKIQNTSIFTTNNMDLVNCLHYLSSDDYTFKKTPTDLTTGAMKVSVFMKTLNIFGDNSLKCNCKQLNALATLCSLKKFENDCQNTEIFHEKFLKPFCLFSSELKVPDGDNKLEGVLNGIIDNYDRLNFERLTSFLSVINPIVSQLKWDCEQPSHYHMLCKNMENGWTIKELYEVLYDSDKNQYSKIKVNFIVKFVERLYSFTIFKNFKDIIKNKTGRNEMSETEVQCYGNILDEIHESNDWIFNYDNRLEEGTALTNIFDVFYSKDQSCEDFRKGISGYLTAYGTPVLPTIYGFRNVLKLAKDKGIEVEQFKPCMDASTQLINLLATHFTDTEKHFHDYKGTEGQNEFTKYYQIAFDFEFLRIVHNDIIELLLEKMNESDFCTQKVENLNIVNFFETLYKIENNSEEHTKLKEGDLVFLYVSRLKVKKENENVILPPSMRVTYPKMIIAQIIEIE